MALLLKNPPVNAGNMRHGFDPWVRKIPWRRKWQSTPVFLPGESHGQRSLAGYIQFMGSQSWTRLKRLSMLVCEAKRRNHLSMERGKPVLFHRLHEHIHAIFTSSLNIPAPFSTVYSAFLQINFFLN